MNKASVRRQVETWMKADAALIAPDYALLLYHFYYQEAGALGAFRHTVPKYGKLMSLFSETVREEEAEKVFTTHTSIFGRGTIMLDWLLAWAASACAARFPSEAGLCFFDAEFAVVEGTENMEVKSEVDGEARIVVRLPPALAATLVPDILIEQYLETLASQRVPAPDIVRRLEGARIVALDQMQSEARARLFEAFSAEDTEKQWRLFGALQSTLVFMVGASGQRGTYLGCKCRGVFLAERDEKVGPNRPALLLTAIASGNVAFSLAQAAPAKAYVDRLTAQTRIRTLNLPSTGRWEGGTIEPLIRKALEEELGAFSAHWVSLLLWVTRIIEQLRGTIHEGKALGYYVIVDDETRLEDTPVFVLTRLRPDDASLDKGFAAWNEDGSLPETNVRAVLDRIRAAFSKGNYSWFRGGHYAVLWDATFPPRLPDRLVRLRGSTWNVYLAEALHGRALGVSERRDREVLALAYVQPDGNGGLMVRNRAILRFRGDSNWEASGGARENWLGRRLAGVEWLNSHEAERMRKLCCALSDDPDAGAMVVLFKVGKAGADVFWAMGDPWLPLTRDGKAPILLKDYEDSDLIALMSMDGATCLWRPTEDAPVHIAFRRLVTSPRLEKASAEMLLHDLRWEGSRKWSAAGGAHHPEVELILAISQDGPLSVYDLQNGRVRVERFPP
jgi:hypothetical protein